MNHLQRRINKLEAIFKKETEETRSEKPHRLSDWTDEELNLACACFSRDEPLPPDLEEKYKLTDMNYTRIVGMSLGEIDVALGQLCVEDDDSNDDLSVYYDEVMDLT